MKFKIFTEQTDSGRTHWEEYEKDISDPEKWAKETLDNFNATLRPKESPRKFLEVVIIGDENNEELHKWDKNITGMSVLFRGLIVDIMYCQKCGITGKRYGLRPRVVIDSKYRKKDFRKCNLAKKLLAEMDI